MENPRRRVSIVTKIFSVFLLITAIDLSAIYLFTGTGQIDQISRNGQLVAENAALRLAAALGEQGKKSLNDTVAQVSAAGGYQLQQCRVLDHEGRDTDAGGAVSPRALRALRLFESERRLFYADLTVASFTADIFLPQLKNGRLSVVACAVQLNSLRESFERLLRISLIIFAVTLVLQAALAWFIYAVFIARLRTLEKASLRIATGDFGGGFQPSRRPDEIDLLAQTFDEMRISLAEKTRVLEETLLNLEKANFDLEGDLILGQEIQQSILPLSGVGKALSWSVTYRPLSRVSGDFYDIFDLPGGTTAVLQFDASGHGVPAALLTMMAKISFVEAIQKFSQPDEIIASVNRELSEHLQQTGNFLTAFLGIIDNAGTMTWCSAAHTRAIYISAQGKAPQFLDPTSLSIGFAPVEPGIFKSATTRLARGDILLIYTDGLTESRTAEGTEFGAARVAAIAARHAAAGEKKLHEALLAEWQQAVPRQSVDDDVTLLTVSLR